MNWLWVHTEATVVISLIVTSGGALLPKTVKNAMAELSSLALLTGVPPLAVRYSVASLAGVASVRRLNLPSEPARICASCWGSAELAAHRVTVDPATGPPPACTRPARLPAPYAGMHVDATNPTANRGVAIRELLIYNTATSAIHQGLADGT